jgi:hypothetical protein
MWDSFRHALATLLIFRTKSCHINYQLRLVVAENKEHFLLTWNTFRHVLVALLIQFSEVKSVELITVSTTVHMQGMVSEIGEAERNNSK